MDTSGNIESTPASFAWYVDTATSMLYNGDQIVVLGNAFTPAGLLSSPGAACVSGQPVTFSLERSPITGAAGTYPLGRANTAGSGQVTLSSIATTHWLTGVYNITASYAGSALCNATSYTATLTAAAAGIAASGGGWYTTPGAGRIDFGFTAYKEPNTGGQYKGQAVIQDNGKWRLKATVVNPFTKVANKLQGSAKGLGTLYWWDPTLSGGLGGWHLAKDGVAFTMTFTDVGSGTTSTDTMGVNIQYTPVSPQPTTMPNSTPQPLKGGNIKVS